MDSAADDYSCIQTMWRHVKVVCRCPAWILLRMPTPSGRACRSTPNVLLAACLQHPKPSRCDQYQLLLAKRPAPSPLTCCTQQCDPRPGKRCKARHEIDLRACGCLLAGLRTQQKVFLQDLAFPHVLYNTSFVIWAASSPS